MENVSRNVTSQANFTPSIHSSRMTDAASEDADEYYPEGAASRASKASKSKTGKNSLTGSNRPVSPPRSFYSRHGSGRRGFGGPGLSMANSSRVESLYNRKSMSHAPSLTSNAFFRPMSSQRLQAQRTQRPNTGTQESSRLSSATMDRPSVDSNNPATPTSPGRREHTRPSSRGTDFTDGDVGELPTIDAGRARNDTLESAAESTSPLRPVPRIQQEDESEKEPVSDVPRRARNSTAPAASQFANHDRYSNDTNSPHLREKIQPRPTARGKNYEYFSGNTVFFWGGRLQNTRDRPINIITGILMIVPIILFFVFE